MQATYVLDRLLPHAINEIYRQLGNHATTQPQEPPTMDTKSFLGGIVLGASIAIAAMFLAIRAQDATPVYNQGYSDGIAAAHE